MNEQEAQRERQRMTERSQSVPDHVREGKTLPQQIEGDHAYRDEPPEPGPREGEDRAEYWDTQHERDPSLWATHGLVCLSCGTEFPSAPDGDRRDRLESGEIDVGRCPACDRDVPVVESGVLREFVEDKGEGYRRGFLPEVRAYSEGMFHGFAEWLGFEVSNIAVLKGESDFPPGDS